MAVKLGKKEQLDLNVATRKLQGLKYALNAVAEQIGGAEIDLWALAKKLGKGQKVVRIDYDGPKSKLITDKEDL